MTGVHKICRVRKGSGAISLPKWTEVLVVLYNTPEAHRYCGRLYRKTGITARHLRNLMADMEDMQFVRRREGTKIRYIALTKTGTRLAQLFLEIYPTLKR